MSISMRDYERIYNTVVNQIIFMNTRGEYEYHPEREEILLNYFYLKSFVGYKFKTEYSFDTDLFSLEFYKELANEIEEVMTVDVIKNKFNDSQFVALEDAIKSKIEYEKNLIYKKNDYGLTDVYLANLVSKITDWLEDNGITQFLEVISKTGEELGNKELQGTKSETK